MSSMGMRPSKLWHWVALFALTATFLAEPSRFLATVWELFKATGQIGSAVIDGEDPGVFDDPATVVTPGHDPLTDGETADAGAGAGGFPVAPARLRPLLDTGARTVQELHNEVIDARDRYPYEPYTGSTR